MAYIFKSIAATQFLSNMLCIYLFVNCNIFLCFTMLLNVFMLLNVQVSNGYFIATFSENVENHKYLARDRAISSEFLTHRVVFYTKGKIFNFHHFWRPSWILAENKTLKISSKW